MLGIETEISVFLQAVLSGSSVLLTYWCIRVVRRIIRHNLFFISVEDFLFWIGTGLYLFYEIYNTSDGSIRLFFVIGVIVGVLLVYALINIIKKMYESVHRRICSKRKKSID